MTNHYNNKKESIVSFFTKSPLCGIEGDFERDKSLPRDENLLE